MVLQVLNIASGAVTALPNTDIKNKLAPFETRSGLALIVVGLIGLIERLGIFYTGLPLGSSFPQVIPLLAIGLLMAAPVLEKYAFLKKIIDMLRPHKKWIGIIALVCGLGSILFGCIYPVCYPMPF